MSTPPTALDLLNAAATVAHAFAAASTAAGRCNMGNPQFHSHNAIQEAAHDAIKYAAEAAAQYERAKAGQ